MCYLEIALDLESEGLSGVAFPALWLGDPGASHFNSPAGSSICAMGPVVLTEKPEACWWGEPCLHVSCLVVLLLPLPHRLPGPSPLPALPLGGLGKVDSRPPEDFLLSLVTNPGLD